MADIGPASPKQEMFLNTPADICVFGGAAGSGKSTLGLMHMLKYAHKPKFRGVIVRRTTPQLTSPGGLWDTAKEFYMQFDPRMIFKTKDMKCVTPHKAEIAFRHCERVQDKYNFQGAQLSSVLVDEGTQFVEEIVTYLMSRLRTSDPTIKPNMRITCNPDYDSYLRKWIEWYLQDDGRPDETKDGVIRYFIRQNNEMMWGNSKEELYDLYGDKVLPLSFTFISANVYDNPILLKNNPEYLSWLEGLPRVEKERLLYGNWFVRESAVGYWKREWPEMIPMRPLRAKKRVRAWDISGTLPSESYPNPDWTAGVLMSTDEYDNFVVEDVVRFRDRYHGVFEQILRCAQEDGTDTAIVIPADPGAAGKAYASQLVTDLAARGYYCRIKTTNKNKVTRFAPFASVSEAGNVKILSASWNDVYLDELESFDGSRNKKDDMVDATSDAFWYLSQTLTIPDFTLPDMLQSNPFKINY